MPCIAFGLRLFSNYRSKAWIGENLDKIRRELICASCIEDVGGVH